MKLRITLAVCIIAFFVAGIWMIQNPTEYEKNDTLMDTFVSIRASGWGAKEKVLAAVERMRQIEQRMSKTIANSDVSRINRGDTYWGNAETMRVIRRGIFFGQQSNGVFDISIGPITSLYKRTANPSESEIATAKSLVNYKNLKELQPLPAGMAIDLGGIAKGYAGDEAALFLRRNGITNVMINMGGDIITTGDKEWKVGIQNPFEESGKTMGVLTVINRCVATSGQYERGAHIYDPRTGKPVNNNVASATVIAGSGMDADALATILYILGPEGLPLIEKNRGKGIVITKDNKVYMSADVSFKITDKNFTKVGE